MGGDDMRLSGRTLPGYRATAEYFRSANGKRGGFLIDLVEMGWVLGVNALFREDADKVMTFLTKVAHGLDTDKLEIMPVEGDSSAPLAILNGKRFPDTVTELDLQFLRQPSVISYFTKTSSHSRLRLNRKEYGENSQELKAFDLAMEELNKDASEHFTKYKHTDIIKVTNISEEGDRTYFIEEQLTILESCEKSVRIILDSASYVQRAVTATNRVNELHRQRIRTLADTLVSS